MCGLSLDTIKIPKSTFEPRAVLGTDDMQTQHQSMKGENVIEDCGVPCILWHILCFCTVEYRRLFKGGLVSGSLSDTSRARLLSWSRDCTDGGAGVHD